MRRKLLRLSAKEVAAKSTPGYFCDGLGLYLQVAPSGSKSWIFRYTLAGRCREMGVGSVAVFSLAEARERASDARKLLADGKDPIEVRDAQRAAQALDAANTRTFDDCAAAYIKGHRAGWRNPKHADQWENTLATYCSHVFGHLPIRAIDTGLVLRALEPIWAKKKETASRLRGRIETILDWATTRGYRAGENPARWRGHLEHSLANFHRAKRIEHHPALPYAEVPKFLQDLRKQEGAAARALELVLFTVARTGELVGARWDEIDQGARTWTIPGERMKGGRPHRVPLSPQACALVRALPRVENAVFVFPGRRPGQPMSNMAMLQLLKRMNRSDITVHGFRSSFRDWCAERTNYPREVCEMALAHAIGDQVEAAYRRGDLFERRRRLMNEWARFCETTAAATVLPLRKRSKTDA